MADDGSGPGADARDDDALVAAARQAAERAHSPYSGVRVGAAVRAADGRVSVGCNVENASYGLTLCAERSALVRAVVEGLEDLQVVAIWASTAGALSPCGACRQFLHELAPHARVLWEATDGERREATVAALLPDAIGGGDLR